MGDYAPPNASDSSFDKSARLGYVRLGGQIFFQSWCFQGLSSAQSTSVPDGIFLTPPFSSHRGNGTAS
jgi:hypothetical protein